mmetsp:Transcript_43012/g.74204  ORF Transcript_43012/g.74204 Transcript_43012/m.74204 type:complete len:123 (+) Transcript_43012:78-446(+)
MGVPQLLLWGTKATRDAALKLGWLVMMSKQAVMVICYPVHHSCPNYDGYVYFSCPFFAPSFLSPSTTSVLVASSVVAVVICKLFCISPILPFAALSHSNHYVITSSSPLPSRFTGGGIIIFF